MSKKNRKIAEIDLSSADPSTGLNAQQVKERMDAGLVNKIPKTVTKTYFRIFLDNVINFFNIIIFGLSIYMMAVGADFTKFVSLYLLIINIGIGLFQDIKARHKVDKLKVVSYPTVNVLRDGQESTIPANEIVLGDVVILKLGDQIIADSIILEGSLEVNESLLTGESLNVHKSPQNMVFSGSFVTSGYAKVRVEKVGKDNYATSLQNKAKKFRRPKSEILRSIKKIFLVIGVFIIALGLMMFITFLVQGKLTGEDYKDNAIKFASSIFAMIPIGMYLLTSLTLAVGVIRLARRKMLVQELYCIETLARVDTLCLDKTGTITDGTMSLKEIKPLSELSVDDIKTILHTLIVSTKGSNATATALLNALNNEKSLDYTSSLAFSSVRKYSATMLSDGRCFLLGAREFMNHNHDFDQQFIEYERKGFRVLLLGYSSVGLKDDSLMPSVEPIAIIVLEEHIKDDAYENIKWFKDNGVNIKIISGDNPISVSEIAIRVGVNNAERWVSLEDKSLEEVRQIANEYTVFGRVSPEQKEALISSMQEEKHVVAMTGDGVNDILALKTADCSIAMANGSDAAKAVSHLVSLDSNFSSLPNVVAEGRRVINNLQRSCSIFLVKTIFAMIMTFVFLIASWINEENGYPFVTNNMYIWELLTIGFASFFLSLQPNEERIQNKFFDNIMNKSLLGGIVQSIACLIIFIISWANPDFLSLETATTLCVITFTLISFVTLLIISWPFDIYRRLLSVTIAILMSAFFLIDYFAFKPKSFFNIQYELITVNNWYILVIVLIIAIILYIFLTIFVNKLQNKINEKRTKYEN